MHTLAPPSLKEIILSTGSIGTPHILLHSGIGDDAELATLGIPSTLHLPDVGKNLTDHPGWSIIFSVNSTETVDSVYFRNTTFQREALAEWQASKTGYLTGGLANQIGFLRIRKIRGCWKMNRVRGMRRRITSYSLWCVHRHRFWNKLTFPPQNGRFWGPVPETGNFFRISTVVLCPLSRMFAF